MTSTERKKIVIQRRHSDTSSSDLSTTATHWNSIYESSVLYLTHISLPEETGVWFSWWRFWWNMGVSVSGEVGGGMQGDSRRSGPRPESLDT